jgi:hypothetical protein
MKTKHHIEITSAELANLWTAYVNDSLAICVMSHFLANVQDTQTQSVLQHALKLSQEHVKKLKSLYKEEQIAIPEGFTKEDVAENTPRLFTDDFYLIYIQNMGKMGMEAYTLCLSNAARLDICEYFTECMGESLKLYNKATEAMLSKGIFSRSPYIPKPRKVEYVQKQSFLTGWFGNRRPLNSIEISSIYFNMQRNVLGKALVSGFGQVAKSNQVRTYMQRGRGISSKHIENFGSLLTEDDLPVETTWSAESTDSTVPPFSDKLMMFHTTSLNGIGIGHYGQGLGTSSRRDLSAMYTRLMAEVGQYAEDGVNIMIDNGWLEQPPTAVNRDELTKSPK